MAEKLSLRLINLVYMNLLIFITIAVLVTCYSKELNWATGSFSDYLTGDIEYPREITLYREAEYYLEERDLDSAKRLLEELIGIDPYSEARYLLGEYYFLAGDYDSSLRELTEYTQLYQTNSGAYLKVAKIYEKSGDKKKAISILRRGLNENLDNVERYKPDLDFSVEEECNQKAQQGYETYKYQSKVLKKELILLEQKAGHLWQQ